jgi:hypothetical protein
LGIGAKLKIVGGEFRQAHPAPAMNSGNGK